MKNLCFIYDVRIYILEVSGKRYKLVLSPGPLLPEDFNVRRIPFRQGEDLTVALSGKNCQL